MPGNWMYALGMRICCLYRAFHCRTDRVVLSVVIRRSSWNADSHAFHCRTGVERTYDYGRSVPLRQESEAEESSGNSVEVLVL